MFTGRWPHELSAGCDAPLDGAYPTLAECLRDHGYLTAAFSANIHYANTTYGLGRGFARFEDHWNNQRVLPWEIARSSLLGSTTLEGLSFLGLRGWRVKMHRKHAPEVNHQALAWLDGRRQAGDRRPFFMFLNYMDAHGPYTLPRDVKPAYPVDFFALEAKKDQVRRFRGELSKGVGRHGRLNVRADDPAEIKALIGEIAATSRDAYDSCLIYLDGNIGMLISELRRRGELESTIVVVTSDHGEHLGEHGKFDHGVTLYRELVHVPLVLSGPGVPVGAEVKPVVSTRQLPASVCELAGIAEHPFEGPSLAAAWHEPFRSEAPFPPVLCEVEHMAHIPRAPHVPASLGPIWAVVGPTHTYIRGGPNGEELYRLEGDPNEERDLSRARDAQRALVQARRAWARFLATNVAPRYQPNARR
jgi:arylsulfatase A-like enzyme